MGYIIFIAIGLTPLFFVVVFVKTSKNTVKSAFEFLTITLSCYGIYGLSLSVAGLLHTYSESYMYLNCSWSDAKDRPCSDLIYTANNTVQEWAFIVFLCISILLQTWYLYALRKKKIFNK